ncbi:MAG: hypothetical protein M3393_01205 [Actinomycetota bacterium]|nr:hypothetical protein [Actinomycetota bacterium]
MTSHSRHRVAALVLAAVLALGSSVVWLGDRCRRDALAVSQSRSVKATTPGLATDAPPAAPTRAVAVLHAWDAQRSGAYAHADLAALRGLYTVGSRAGTTDVALLRDYLGRGLRVKGLRMQLLAVEVVSSDPRRWRLRVTDRLHAGLVVDRRGRRVVLPRDQATTRIMTLRRVSGDAGWKVSAVRRSAPRPTGR